MLLHLKSLLWNSLVGWYLLFLLGFIRLFIKSRDLFPLIAGSVFSMDTEKWLIHAEHIRCKSMIPKTTYFYVVLYSPFYCEDL